MYMSQITQAWPTLLLTFLLRVTSWTVDTTLWRPSSCCCAWRPSTQRRSRCYVATTSRAKSRRSMAFTRSACASMATLTPGSIVSKFSTTSTWLRYVSVYTYNATTNLHTNLPSIFSTFLYSWWTSAFSACMEACRPSCVPSTRYRYGGWMCFCSCLFTFSYPCSCLLQLRIQFFCCTLTHLSWRIAHVYILYSANRCWSGCRRSRTRARTATSCGPTQRTSPVGPSARGGQVGC